MKHPGQQGWLPLIPHVKIGKSAGLPFFYSKQIFGGQDKDGTIAKFILSQFSQQSKAVIFLIRFGTRK